MDGWMDEEAGVYVEVRGRRSRRHVCVVEEIATGTRHDKESDTRDALDLA